MSLIGYVLETHAQLAQATQSHADSYTARNRKVAFRAKALESIRSPATNHKHASRNDSVSGSAPRLGTADAKGEGP
jgi:hypothetical protein